MNCIPNRLRFVGLAALALGILVGSLPMASAGHDVYLPGWNQPPQDVPPPLFDFRSGFGWGDYQRYWPDQTTRGSSHKSSPFEYGPTVYTRGSGGHRYHQMQ